MYIDLFVDIFVVAIVAVANCVILLLFICNCGSTTTDEQETQQHQNYTVTTRVIRTKRLNNLCMIDICVAVLVVTVSCCCCCTSVIVDPQLQMNKKQEQHQNYIVTSRIIRTKRLNNLCRFISFFLLLLLSNFVVVHLSLYMHNDRQITKTTWNSNNNSNTEQST